MNIDELIAQVRSDKYKVICFGVFNTLILRPVIRSGDMNVLLGRKLGVEGLGDIIRRCNDYDALQNRCYEPSSARTFGTISEILPVYGLDPEKAVNEEEKMYLQLCSARKSMLAVWKAAVASGKKVCVAEDTQLSAKTITLLLEKNGFEGCDGVYISSELQMRKSDGSLFSKIISDYSDVISKPAEILNLGGIFDADIKKANSMSLSTVFIPTPVTLLKKSRMLGQLYNNLPSEPDNGFLIAHSANLMFDDPFISYSDKDYFNSDVNNFSRYVFGPMLLIFTKWMLDDCEKLGITDLCYVYRDGYLTEKVHKILEKYYNPVNIRRIYITRSIVNTFLSAEKNGLSESLKEYPAGEGMTLDLFIRERLFVSEDDADYEEIKNLFAEHGLSLSSRIVREDYESLAPVLQPYFSKHGKKYAEESYNYIHSVIDECEKTAVFDVGYRGSACALLRDKFDLETVGYHFFAKELLKNSNSSGLDVKAPVILGESDIQKTTIIQILTEDLLNSQEDSVKFVKKQGDEFEFIRDKKHYFSDKIDLIQNQSVEYAESFVSVLGEYIRELDFDFVSYFEFYRRMLEKMPRSDAELFTDIRFEDSTFLRPKAENAYVAMYKRICGSPAAKKTEQPSAAYTPVHSQFRETVYAWLRDHGILPPFKWAWRFGTGIVKKIISAVKHEKLINADVQKVFDDFEHSIRTVSDDLRYRLRPTVIFCGHNAAFDKGTCNYINSIAAHIPEYDFLFISEAPYVTGNVLRKKIRIDCKTLHYVPMSNSFHIGIDMPMDKELERFISSKPYLKETVEGITARFKNMGKNYPKYLTQYLYRYYNKLIDVYTKDNAPVTFVLWNEFTSMHFLLFNICKERGIPVRFFEFGVLPGTLCLEDKGQMGESRIADEEENFVSRAVTAEEETAAGKLLDELKRTGLNRNPQPINNELDIIKSKLDPGKPTVIYFGQNDFESGMYPYTENTRRYHSPVYKTSNDAALAIEKVCREKGYNFIYKPHPTIMQMYGCSNKFASGTIIANSVDINKLIDLATVCVTILSQAAYVALIREKPVVMLGYNQLKGKGCAYECYNNAGLSATLEKAVDNGYTSEQKKAFIRHTAQLNKYYLFDDKSNKAGNWGRDITKTRLIFDEIFGNRPIITNDNNKKMKVAVIASMPANYYSGGRSHAWNLAESLSYKGNKVYFIANNMPIFKDAMKDSGLDNPIEFIKLDTSNIDIPGETELDYLIIVPHRDRNETFYLRARNFAIKMNAKLVLVNFESGNWVNKYLDNELPDELWLPWRNVCKDGCMILSSDLESMKYAKEYYLVNPSHTAFDYWYPTVNTVAADNVPDVPKENNIVAFIRLNDKYKGSYDILEMIDESLAGYKLVLLYGTGKIDDTYKNYVAKLDELKERYGVDYEIKIQLTDEEKFTEIKKAKYMLFPSYFEGYGTPPIEAQYCNTICFAYDLPVLEETAGNGIVFCNYADPADMKKKLVEHIRNNISYENLKESVYELANFRICADKLDKMFRSHLNDDWRDPNAHTTIF